MRIDGYEAQYTHESQVVIYAGKAILMYRSDEKEYWESMNDMYVEETLLKNWDALCQFYKEEKLKHSL